MLSVVLCAADIGASGALLGGGRARRLLEQGFVAAGTSVELARFDQMPVGRDVYVMESPVKAEHVRRANSKVTFILRHGDCQMAFLAYETINSPNVFLVTPTAWAYDHMLGYRVDQHLVQWMCLEPIDDIRLTRGNKALHVRAFDFMKDTPMAIRVATQLADVSFVFRAQAGAARAEVPSNVEVLEATTSQEDLWRGIGCLIVTSRAETFCISAYEALARGIPVVAHSSQGAVAEWAGDAVVFAGTDDGLARAVREAIASPPDAARLRARAKHAHQTALTQFSQMIALCRARV